MDTVKVPASLTESGLVPPLLKIKEKAASPLVKVEDPNGFVKVRTLLDTTHSDDVLIGVVTELTVQIIGCKDILDGNVTFILQLAGIECAGLIVRVYKVVADTVVVAATTEKLVMEPVDSISEVTNNPAVISAMLYATPESSA